MAANDLLAVGRCGKADQKRLFRLLAPRTKLNLTLLSGGQLVKTQYARGALDLMHGFASAKSTPAPAVDDRCEAHRGIHQSSHKHHDRIVAHNAVRVMDERARILRPLLDHFTSACPAGCEHLSGRKTWNSTSTLHVDVRGPLRFSAKCFICFAK